MREASLFNGATLLAVERVPSSSGVRLNVLNGFLEPMAESDIANESTGQIVGKAENLAVIANGKHVAQLMQFKIDGHVHSRLVINTDANVYLVILYLS